MRRFDRNELVQFLRSVDKHLQAPASVILIGGAAASLAYGVARTTTDIDTVEHSAELEKAIQRARRETDLPVPVQQAGVYDGPYHYEDRLTPLSLDLERLNVLVPEKHDLVLMKAVRGQENDRETIQHMDNSVGLDRDILIDRFKREMGHAIGDPRERRANFLAVIERLYGEAEADRVSSELTAD